MSLRDPDAATRSPLRRSEQLAPVVPLPQRPSSSRGLRGRLAAGFARVPEPGATIWPAPLAGLVAGIWSAAMSLLVVGAVVLLGWIFAPLGSGQFADVMRASGFAWVLANGGSLRWQGASLSLPPLLVSLVIMLFQRRAGRWLVGAVAAERVAHLVLPFIFALAAAASAQLLVLAAVADGSVFSVMRNMAGAGIVAAVGFAWGIDRELGSPRTASVSIVLQALRNFALVLGAGSVLMVALLSVLKHRGFTGLLSAVAGDSTSVLQVLVLCLVYLPTIVLWAATALLGGTVAVGVGTQVSLTTVALGALPPLPLLALLPDQAPAPGRSLMVVTALAACSMLWPLRGHRSALLRGALLLGSGVAGALLGGAATGAMGPGRLQLLGPTWWQPALAVMAWVGAVLLLDELVHQLRRYLRNRPSDAVEDAN